MAQIKNPARGRALKFTPRGSGWSLGLGFGFLLRLGFGLRLCLLVGFLVRWLGRLVLEVGGVPAAALQLKAGGAEKLVKGRLAANRAFGERRLAHSLQKLLLVAAGFAAIFVARHVRRNPLGQRLYR